MFDIYFPFIIFRVCLKLGCYSRSVLSCLWEGGVVFGGVWFSFWCRIVIYLHDWIELKWNELNCRLLVLRITLSENVENIMLFGGRGYVLFGFVVLFGCLNWTWNQMTIRIMGWMHDWAGLGWTGNTTQMGNEKLWKNKLNIILFINIFF